MNAPADDREGFAAFLLRMRSRGLDNKALAAAIEATPRRAFIPDQWQEHAWLDGMLPIECGEAIESIDLQALARLTKVGSRFDREDIAQVRLQPLTAGLAKVL